MKKSETLVTPAFLPEPAAKNDAATPVVDHWKVPAFLRRRGFWLIGALLVVGAVVL